MNFIDEIFLRANFQKLRGFLLFGTECRMEPGTYLERLNRADDQVADRLQQALPDRKTYNSVLSDVYDYAGSIGNVYMELGLQTGMLIAVQLFQTLHSSAFPHDATASAPRF